MKKWLFYLLTFLSLFSFSIAQTSTNLCLNPSMETNLNNWYTVGSPTLFERSSAKATDGNYSGHITTDANYEGVRNYTFNIVSGKQYSIKSRIFIVSGQVVIYDNSNRLGDFNEVITTTGQWVENEIIATATTTSTEIIKFTQKSSSTAEWYWDNIEITEVTPDIPPTITQQPQSQSVIEPNSATFTVSATGTEPISYQWIKNGTVNVGTNSPTYTTTATTTSMDGDTYKCTVSNSVDNATSNSATLSVNPATVIDNLCLNPSMETNFNNWYTVGSPTLFERSTTKYFDGNYSGHVTTDANYEGVRNYKFNIISGKQYSIKSKIFIVSGKVVIYDNSNRLGDFNEVITTTGQWVENEIIATATTTSTEIILFTQKSSSTAEWYWDHIEISEVTEILTSPTDLEVDPSGDNLDLSWIDNNLNEDGFKIFRSSNGVNFEHLTNTTSTAYSDYVGDDKNYYYKVCAFKGTSTSNFSDYASGTTHDLGEEIPFPCTTEMKLTDYIVENNYIKITSNSGRCEFLYNSDPSVYDIHISYLDEKIGSTHYKFDPDEFQQEEYKLDEDQEWEWDSNNAIDNDENVTHIIKNVQIAPASFPNILAETTTESAILYEVKLVPSTPTINTQPQDQTVAIGETATFSVSAIGGKPLSYQWIKNGTTNVGTNSPTYTIASTIISMDDDTYHCVVSNTQGSTTSASANLTVNGSPTNIYYIDPIIGSVNGTGTSEKPWKFLYQSNNHDHHPGDIIEIIGDETLDAWNDYIKPLNSGTKESPITYRCEDGHQTTIATDEYKGKAIDLTKDGIAKKHITIQGFKIVSKYWGKIDNTEGVILENLECMHGDEVDLNITEEGNVGYWGEWGFEMHNASYTIIRNNKFSGCQIGNSQDILVIKGSAHHNLIENNIFFNAGHTCINLKGRNDDGTYHTDDDPKFNIIRNNYFFNELHQAINIQAGGFFTLLENNFVERAGTGTPEGTGLKSSLFDNELGAASYTRTTNAIVRNNIFRQCGSSGVDGWENFGAIVNSAILLEATNDYAQYVYPAINNHIFNNVFYKNWGLALSAGLSISSNPNTTVQIPRYEDCIYKNNIFYKNGENVGDLPGQDFSADIHTSGLGNADVCINYTNSEESSTTINNFNDKWTNNLIEDVYKQDVFRYNDILYSVQELNNGIPELTGTVFNDNISANPNFYEPDNTYDKYNLTSVRDQFSLGSNSPCLIAGDYLTFAKNEGNPSNNLIVEDPYYFAGGNNPDNWAGIIDGDEIQVGNEIVKILSIDYTNKTLSLDRNISWDIDDPVSFPHDGIKPDIGLFENTTLSKTANNDSTKSENVEKTESIPNKYELLGNYPNPFNPSTKISYAIPNNSILELKIYDITGRLIRVFNKNENAGYHNITWNGTNGNGANVASGIYFYRIKATSLNGSGEVFYKSAKLLLMK